MTTIPLANRLKRKAHKDLAIAQDSMIAEIYACFPDAVIHGGTAIWRCFGSGRFSEDIDVYLPKKYRRSENIARFLEGLEKRGFEKVKFREKENSIFSLFSFQGVSVRFEAVFENKQNFITKPFEMSDSTYISVYTFSPEELIKEKIAAYEKRRKVRDLYDIYFLLKLVENKNDVSKLLSRFTRDLKEPVDADDLEILIIVGAVPAVKNMLEEIERWAR